MDYDETTNRLHAQLLMDEPVTLFPNPVSTARPSNLPAKAKLSKSTAFDIVKDCENRVGLTFMPDSSKLVSINEDDYRSFENICSYTIRAPSIRLCDVDLKDHTKLLRKFNLYIPKVYLFRSCFSPEFFELLASRCKSKVEEIIVDVNTDSQPDFIFKAFPNLENLEISLPAMESFDLQSWIQLIANSSIGKLQKLCITGTFDQAMSFEMEDVVPLFSKAEPSFKLLLCFNTPRSWIQLLYMDTVQKLAEEGKNLGFVVEKCSYNMIEIRTCQIVTSQTNSPPV